MLNEALTNDFGFKAMLWVFSGRRGIHCWIADEAARTMTNEHRAAVTEYMFLAVSNEMGGGLELSYPLHPMLERAYKHLEKKFEHIIIHEQDILSNPTHQKKFLKLLPFANQADMERAFLKCQTGSQRWAEYDKVLRALKEKEKKVRDAS